MKIMRNSTFLPLTLLLIVFSLHTPTSATSGSEYNYGAHPRFVCTPLPVEADPSCFTKAGPGAGSAGPGGPSQQTAPPGSWVGASEEAKATILHLRESLVQQKEIIQNQRETLRELTAKLTLCEGVGRGVSLHDERHSMTLHHRAHHHRYADNEHYGNQQVRHSNGNLIPDSPHPSPSEGGQHFDGVKGKQVTSEESTSSVQQMERMLQALKERLNNLQQKRNTSSAYSSSLKELLQRKISTLEEQLQHQTAPLAGPDRRGGGVSTRGDRGDDTDDDKGARKGKVGKNAGRDSDEEDEDADGDRGNDDSDSDDDSDDEDSDDEDNSDSDDENDSNSDDENSSDSDEDSDDESDSDDSDDSDEEREDDDDDGEEDKKEDDDDDDDRSNNEADRHSYLPHTYRTGYHSNKLETMLHQLHLKGSNRKKFQNLDAFQISFPMRTNYMYGRMKKTLMQEIFALTLCLWLKAGVGGSGLGTPFSYSAPGQANELVLIEWENNPIELLIDDKAAPLPLSLSDGKWHHVCVTWTTRDGQWEAYQDGVQRGSGMNLSPWRSIKPGGVFILGQEQDTLGGRFDATQSYVGEMSDLNMWSHVLSSSDVYSLASCGSHLRGDVITWSETEVELHGGVARYPFDPCH